MKNPFNLRHWSDKPDTRDRDVKTRKPENAKKEIRVLYEDPMVFGQVPEPADESAEPADDNHGRLIFLIGGSLAVLLCLWWFAPEWLAVTWKNLITQIFRFGGH